MIDIASGVSSLEKAPGYGDAMIVPLSRLNNHREHRGYREKLHRSVLSVYSVFDQLHSDSFFQNKFKNNKPKLNTNERRHITVTEFAAQSNRSIHRKGREERKARLHKSSNLEEIIRTGTRISRIGRIYTDQCAQWQEKAPEHGDLMIISPSRSNNHRDHRGLREKQHRSVLLYEKKLATNTTNSNELTLPEFVSVRTSSMLFSHNYFLSEQNYNHENHSY